ncbi:hypothetical protein P148_SR1C00001G0827 [candidate division SR1 bacterium RAAC1_SR1_1]|nr:hypothetical protein P148_SR1C00001G0827 [candidate division SR1 bacterium RAAC1_SR1_1]
MEENKNQTTPQQPAKAEENTIDFSKFSLGSENTQIPNADANVFQQTPENNGKQESKTQITEQTETKNLIAELNLIQQDTAPDVDISNIIIEESKPENKEAPILGSSGIGKQAITQKSNTKIEQVMSAYIVITISIIAIFFISLYNKYISLSVDTTQATSQTFVEKVQIVTKVISEQTNINEYAKRAEKTDVLTSDDAKNTTKSVIQSQKLNYLHKKDILEKNMTVLNEKTIQNAQSLDNIKKEIIKYGFIPQQLYNIIETQQGTSGIKKRIALMENIRFLTAFKAFSYMESFIQGLANNLGKDPLIVESKLKKTVVDGEKDIVVYTNTCFLNPYEITTNCSMIEDFDNYYKIIDTQRTVDTEFIKQLATYVDNKLQETDVPTFSINFIKFNPKEETLDFTIDLNTHSQDEIALNKQGILNPHVFIVTNLINLLKQSLLVIGEDIKADQIKTNPKTIRVGSTVFTVNNSSIKMSLPIQKSSQREISDFFSSKY